MVKTKSDHCGDITFKIHKYKSLLIRLRPFHSCFVQGLIFVVDSNDRERIGEAKDELSKMVNNNLLCRILLVMWHHS